MIDAQSEEGRPLPQSVFKQSVCSDSLEERLTRIELKLDRLIALIDNKSAHASGSAYASGSSAAAVLDTIYDNIRYPVAYLFGSVSSLRGEREQDGAFSRL